ncbi:hypothetical protein niasHS_008690 [Heterodera schachtii]|uniref:Uncharacterized protein n=1 Tax=Heterodera schachtii TaxID=97005 RepID=A0ABD2JAY3_HETSC
MKKRIYFKWDQWQLSAISAFQSTEFIFTKQIEFDQLTNKSYVDVYPDQWNGLPNNADNDVVTFHINLQEFIGQLTFGELRKTTWVVKRRVCFPKYNGQPYSINAWHNNGQEYIPIFTDVTTVLDDSNNKQCLDIDPDGFEHLDGNALIAFSLAGCQGFYAFGSATVTVLRGVGDIDFSGGLRYYGPLNGGF